MYFFYIMFIFISIKSYSNLDNDKFNTDIGNYFKLSLQNAIENALKNNYSIKYIDLMIKKSSLDIKKEFIDLKDTKLKKIRQKYKIYTLLVERQDIVNNVNFQVYKNYFQAIITYQDFLVAKKDLDFAYKHFKRVKRKYFDGKIDKNLYTKQKQIYQYKKIDLKFKKSQYNSYILSLLFAMGMDLTLRPILVTNILENKDLFDIKKDLESVELLNRYVKKSKLELDLKKIEDSLIDKEFVSLDDIKKSTFKLSQAEISYSKVLQKNKKNLLKKYLEINNNISFLEKARYDVEFTKLDRQTSNYRYRKGYIPEFEKDKFDINYRKAKVIYDLALLRLNLAKLEYSFLLK